MSAPAGSQRCYLRRARPERLKIRGNEIGNATIEVRKKGGKKRQKRGQSTRVLLYFTLILLSLYS